MTETNQDTQAAESNSSPETKADPFAELEAERMANPKEEEEKPQPKGEAKSEKKEPQPKEETKLSDNSKKEEPEEDDKASSLEQELEKTKKSLLESQKWGTKNSQKAKAALKRVNALLESTNFTSEEEDQIKSLRDILQLDSVPEEIEEEPKNSHPIDKFISVAAPKLEIMRELAENAEIFDKEKKAFNFMIMDTPDEELELLLEELDDLKDEPIKLAKKIMELGRENYINYYEDFYKYGGFRKTLKKKNKEIEKLKNEVDKLNKTILNNNGFTENPRYGISDDGNQADAGSDKSSSSNDDPFAAMEQERSQSVKRR